MKTPSGWIYVHLARTGSGWLNEFAAQGLDDESAAAVAADLRAAVEPLRTPPWSRWSVLAFYLQFFGIFIAGWILAFGLALWIVLSRLL